MIVDLARTRPAWRRQGGAWATSWRAPGGADVGFYIRVNCLPPLKPLHTAVGIIPCRALLGRPIEIFLTARGPGGSTLSHYATDVGEMLSLLLQHGHAIDALRARFKPDALARRICECAWILAAQIGADVAKLPPELDAQRVAAFEDSDD